MSGKDIMEDDIIHVSAFYLVDCSLLFYNFYMVLQKKISLCLDLLFYGFIISSDPIVIVISN